MQGLREAPGRVHHTVVVIGGGAAGLAVAAMLRRARRRLSIAIIEPSATHAHPPSRILAAAGQARPGEDERPVAGLIPPRVTWIRQAATALLPDAGVVVLADGSRVAYGALVVCPELAPRWERIDGLTQTLGRNGVCSLHSADGAAYAWQCIRGFVGGVALFTQPPMPVACAGPQEILYLAADHWRARQRLEHSRIEFCLAGHALFEVPFFVPALQRVADSYGILPCYGEELTAIDGRSRVAHFRRTDADGNARAVQRKFDMIHVTPPQAPPDVVRDSPLADGSGWLAVDPASLRHPRYDNVFGLGDAIGTGNARGIDAARMQVPVVARNLLALLDGKPSAARYDGYGACPLAISAGHAILAEFTYGGIVTPSVLFDPRIPSRKAWRMETRRQKRLYRRMLRGKQPRARHRERSFGKE